jgi:hypothetical protein
MKFTRKVVLLAAVAAAWGVLQSGAQAQVGTPNIMAYGFSGTGLYQSMGMTPPYFSMFPPVYYSFPVARTYGYSPFAYPPGYVTPEGERMQAKEVSNPYAPRRPASATGDRTAAMPKEVLNPYVRQKAAASLAARPEME